MEMENKLGLIVPAVPRVFNALLFMMQDNHYSLS